MNKKSGSFVYNIDQEERLDLFLSKKIPSVSRVVIQKLIKLGKIAVNNQNIKPNYQIKSGDKIDYDLQIPQKNDAALLVKKIQLDIIYEDNNVLVINKQADLVVHPSSPNQENTLVQALLSYDSKIADAIYDKDSDISKMRPGIVHRLDKNTTGVIIVAKNSMTLLNLSKQIQSRSVDKTYLALCCGVPKSDKGTLVNYLGRHPKHRKMIAEIGTEKGKEAISNYRIIKTFNYMGQYISLIEFDIKTGRTHQIRVQAKLIGCPVLGDVLYGTKDSINLSRSLKIDRQLLHSKELRICLPRSKNKSIFIAPLPEDFNKVLTIFDYSI